jgi:hypothetical protein
MQHHDTSWCDRGGTATLLLMRPVFLYLHTISHQGVRLRCMEHRHGRDLLG